MIDSRSFRTLAALLLFVACSTALGTAGLQVALAETGDTAPPETFLDSGPWGTVADTFATFFFSASEPGSTFECRLDAAPYGACISPVTYPSLVEGPHTFEVRATDISANTDPTPGSRTWTVDTSLVFPTSLDITAPYKIPSGTKAKITGTLTSSQMPCVDSQRILLKKGGNTVAKTVTTAVGGYSFALKLTRRATVQAVFKGTATCAASESAKRLIAVKGT